MAVPAYDDVVVLVQPVSGAAQEVVIARPLWTRFEYEVERGLPDSTGVRERLVSAAPSGLKSTRVLRSGKRASRSSIRKVA